MRRRQFLQLDETPVALGGRARIFRHPGDHRRLIKVAFASGDHTLAKPLNRLKIIRNFRENLHYQKKFYEKCRSRGICPPIPAVLDPVMTNHGDGVVMEAVTDPASGLGPTLQELVETDQLGTLHLERLSDLVETAVSNEIILPDLQLHNIVWGTARDRTGFFIVDGFDCHTAIRNFGWSRRHDMLRMKRMWTDRVLSPLGLT